MKQADSEPLVTTIKERCRVCYTCVRECPAKAIRIADQQAEVIPDRCIGCGHCVLVCSQHAKRVLSGKGKVETLLKGEARVAALVAPSFPAEFIECEGDVVIGMIRQLGFSLVNEVAFGADLVAAAHKQLLKNEPDGRYISTSCPAVVGYVERYHPELVDQLAPIVSPMVATAKAVRLIHGDDVKTVFIGPCIAKKSEVTNGDIDGVLSFRELREMLLEREISSDETTPSRFDPPLGSKGALFPIGGGMLQAADITEDLMTGEVVKATGRPRFMEAIREFHSGDLDANLLELLCCDGCIMGPGIQADLPLFRRRARVARYVRQRMKHFDEAAWQEAVEKCKTLDLHRTYTPQDQRIAVPSGEEIREILARMGKLRPQDELNCGACGYETCREHAIAIFKGLAESEMCLPYMIEQLRATCEELRDSHHELATTQEALKQSEKLASMGQLAAGVAHEVNNPLGVVLMYAHMLLEEADTGSPIRDDLAMIATQADRCKKIVAGLLDFARENKVRRRRTHVTELPGESIRQVTVPKDVCIQVEHDIKNDLADLDSEQIIQVLTNLIGNAVAAMPQGGKVLVRTEGDDESVRYIVKDTGIGIPQENLKRIFDPFFTTKPIGKGTGLGLAVVYGIVKMHQGDIQVVSNANPDKGQTGTTFTVTLPRKGRVAAV